MNGLSVKLLGDTRLSRLGMVAWVLLGLGVGVGGTSSGQLWWDTLHPKPVVISRVRVAPLSDGGYKLIVNMLVPKTTNCLRLAQHVISRNPDATEGSYQPLGSAIAGDDFSGGGPITVELRVDPYMVHEGELWFYTYRAAYECTRFPGLLRVIDWQSEPIPVVFADN